MSAQRAEPTPQEVAAIIAAVEAVIASDQAAVQSPAGPDGSSPWRFSGRWWTRPGVTRRDRPWITRSAIRRHV